MAFTGKDPKDTYLAVLNIGDANDSLQPIAASVVRDAAGNSSLLELSQSVVAFTGIMSADVVGGMVFDAGITVEADNFITDALKDKTDNNVGVYFTSGDPEGALTAEVGSVALRRDGSSGATMYVKESGSGNTGWTQFDLYANFLDLLDTPMTYTADKWLKVNGSGTALELTNPPTVALGLFKDLTDTPPSYTGFGGKVVKVDLGEAGLTFGDAPASAFLDLTDTPGAYIPLKMLRVNAGGTLLEFVDAPAGTFVGHPDTPANYSGGVAGYRLKVNGTPDAIVFAADTFLNLTDTPASYIANQWLKVNGAGTGLELTSAPAVSFLALTDTPVNYTGAAAGFVAVDAAGSSIEFIGIGAAQGEVMFFDGTNWTALAVGTSGQVLTSGGAAADVSWEDAAGAFLTLTDTPADYTGQAGKTVKVNVGETALEFTDPGGGTFLDLTDTPASYPADYGFSFPFLNAAEDALEFPLNPLLPLGAFAPFTPVGAIPYIDADQGDWLIIAPPFPAGDPPPRMYLVMDPSNDPNDFPGGPGILGGAPQWDVISVAIGEVLNNYIVGNPDYSLPFVTNATDPLSAELNYISLLDMLADANFVGVAPGDGEVLKYTTLGGVEWGAAGGGSTPKYYDRVQEPVTNGNPVTPEILFDGSGDVIMVVTTTEYTTH